MSVVERLRAFRYATSTREIPWAHLRSVDVAAHRVSEPDLQLMKNMISLLSDCSLSSAVSSSSSSADIYQLIGVLQLALQFTLWSQSILKEQLVEKQSGDAVRQINSSYVKGLEKKLDASRQEAIKLREDRDAFQTACRSLEQRLTQTETTIRCLERDLEFERKRLESVIPCIASTKEERQRDTQHVPPASLQPPLLKANYARKEANTTCSRCREACRRKRQMRHDHRGSRSVSNSTSSSLPCRDALIRRSRDQEERAALLQMLRQERLEPISPPQQHPQPLLSSPAPALQSCSADTEIAPMKEESTLPAGILDAIRTKVDEVLAQMVTSCEAMHSSLDAAVEKSLQRTAAMVEQAEQSINDFWTSRMTEQVHELQEHKKFLLQWQGDAQKMLDARLQTVVECLKVEAANKEEQQQQEQLSPASLPLVTSSENHKETMCRHCRQPLSAMMLSAHEAGCGLRLVKCSKCGQAVVAQLLSRHKCLDNAHSEMGSSETASLVRASSVMLQKTQRELQMLLKEGEEIEEDPVAHDNRL